MADSEPVQFFDIISTLPGTSKSWSPNTLKVRTVLNFKGIPYTQSWISYPDIAPLIKSLDLKPNETGTPYTLPAIIHKSSVTSNSYGAMMDSLPIVMHLDKAFPSPPLFPSGDASYALLVAVGKIATGMGPAIRSLIIPNVPQHLDSRGQEYFIRTRTEAYGKPLSEIRPTDQETLDSMWKQVETEAAALLKMLKGREGKKGPFFEGEKAGYADLFLVCHFAFFHRMVPEYFDKLMALGEGEFKALWDACLPWINGQGEEKEWPVPSIA
ncbi:Glutathione S-transferase-like protein ustS [Penicillium macrosclerotiorum]|uniref:Glutathione S-transferase-like protein ustS n=1 Tax=Penicillium macrosclerotiorum TaxID=303699 RepID=UPI002547BC29|nr:Glutathione S-transferase-like protein ustS [Penicillium macrosclerotiorum]KAJ5692213.1 Glutathione S-transferase-like protein ustS [Penicillium macrosclerotiorum]